jgi:hypothetical protein
MSIVQTQTTSFKAQVYQAVHNLLTDTLYIALYDGFANLNADTTVYTTVHEVVATGYTAGGQALTGVTLNTYGYTVYVNFNNAVWTGATITARCALIYNVTQGNKSIAILDFGADKTQTDFTITMPSNTYNSALIRYSN